MSKTTTDEDAAMEEHLASIQHDIWSHWIRWFFENDTPENRERWRRQMVTPYAELSERERESDRKVVRDFGLAVFRAEARREPHTRCRFSTGIDGSITAGSGDLDANGYWSQPCDSCMKWANECEDARAMWQRSEREACERIVEEMRDQCREIGVWRVWLLDDLLRRLRERAK